MGHLRKIAALFAVTMATCNGAAAQNINDEPIDQKWAPTEWGAEDKVGASIARRRRSF